MKQVVQDFRRGSIAVEDVPPPALHGPGVLLATACSLISPGTERAALELGRSSLLGKALRRPDQVRKVLDTLRREGFRQTWNKVQARLDSSRAMGYSAAGVVLVARDSDFTPGDRVACVGTGAATHAEINFVPRNLCARIPDNVSFEEAAFVALGGIALHALHLSEARLGEDVAVLGLGPVGLLLAQCLRAAGCRVAGFDLREHRLRMARTLGVERAAVADSAALEETLHAWGIPEKFDRIFICAASADAAPAEWAVAAAHDRARIVVVGDVRADFPRNACYAKELSIVFARSYGPGRYDPVYEEQGVDYPRAYVRWTLGRNLDSFLDLVSRAQVRVAPLVTHRFTIEEAVRAYEVVSGQEPSLGVVLQYPLADTRPASTVTLRSLPPSSGGSLKLLLGCIGAGAFATGTVFPLLKANKNVELVSVAASRGLSAKRAAERFGFARCSTDAMEVIRDPGVNAVFIATQHSLHAPLTIAAIEAGKDVFVEKPLCLSEAELVQIESAWNQNRVRVQIGFNRRYAQATRALEDFFGRASRPRRAPLSIHYAVHAGSLPEGHWLHDPAEGGRIRGEVCHFVDWCHSLVHAPFVKLFAARQGEFPDENLHALLEFADGSVATIVYDTAAHSSLPKEIIEISSGGRTVRIEDFVRGTFVSGSASQQRRFRGKGHEFFAAIGPHGGKEDVRAFEALTFDDWTASTRATLKLLESADTALPVWFEFS